MKKKLRTILLRSWQNSKNDMIFYLFIVFLCSSILAMSLFFTSGETIEKNVASQLSLDLSYTNDNYFGSEGESSVSTVNLYDTNPTLNISITDTYLEDLEALCKDELLEYYNYNIVLPGTMSIINNDTNDTTYVNLYGISNTEYFERNDIEITEGSISDLDDNGVLLPDSYMEYGYALGTTYTITDPFDTTNFIKQLTVIGFYHDNRWSVSTEDTFVNSNAFVVLNDTVKEILHACTWYYGYYEYLDPFTNSGIVREDYESDDEYLNAIEAWYEENSDISKYVAHVVIDNITFTLKDIDGYGTFVNTFNAFSLEENRKLAKIISEAGETRSLGLKTNVNRFGSVLKSINRIKLIYQFIFTGIWSLLIISLFGFISFLQKKKTREIGIRKALGERKKKTLTFYIKYYIYSSLPLIMIGNICGYFLSILIGLKVTQNNIELQEEMAQLSGDKLQEFTNITMFNDSLTKISFVFLGISIIMILTIIISVIMTTLNILNKNVRKQVRGEIL